MSFNYAQIIEEHGKVQGISNLSKQENKPSLIQINEYDIRLLPCYYNNGEFEGYYTNLSTDKEIITANGTDETIITAKVNTWDDQDPQEEQSVIFVVDGEEQTAVTTVNGQAALSVSSSSVTDIEITAHVQDFKNSWDGRLTIYAE